MSCDLHLARLLVASSLVLVSLGSESAISSHPAEKQIDEQVVPLDQIWAIDIRGTRSLDKSAPAADIDKFNLIGESWYERAERLKFENLSRPGFAVPDSGLQAFRNAITVFSDDKKRRTSFSDSENISLVIFSEPAGRELKFHYVKRTGGLLLET